MKIPYFQKFSLIDYPGKISAIIFTQGCNFRCPYCHNPELVNPELFTETLEEEAIFSFLRKRKNKLDAVVITGGEPTLQPDLMEFAEKIKEMGYLVKLDTNGSNPELLRKLINRALVDYVAMDVKSQLDESSYCKVTQSPNMLGEVKKSIRILLEGEIKYEFRTTVVPTIHQREDILKLAMELNGADRLRIQNFRPSDTIIDPALKKIKPFPDAEICFLQQRVNDIIGEHPVTD